jgi:hypothetical protein
VRIRTTGCRHDDLIVATALKSHATVDGKEAALQEPPPLMAKVVAEVTLPTPFYVVDGIRLSTAISARGLHAKSWHPRIFVDLPHLPAQSASARRLPSPHIRVR